MGYDVRKVGRHEGVNCDLLIQTGFASSVALRSQIEARKPYIIMEAPFFRDSTIYGTLTASSWGYNGLAGGAWRPTPPDLPRPSPRLLDAVVEGSKELIIGQKPTDHSLRGTDHVDWILNKRLLLPEADFRPHPLMVPHGTLQPIADVLRSYRKVHIYTSTVGVDAMVAGCEVYADSDKALCGVANDTRTREAILHDLSWGQEDHANYDTLGPYIFSGYDEARVRAEAGKVERPRGRVDGQAISERYNRAIIC